MLGKHLGLDHEAVILSFTCNCLAGFIANRPVINIINTMNKPPLTAPLTAYLKKKYRGGAPYKNLKNVTSVLCILGNS